jgi:putative two-component system response regulator
MKILTAEDNSFYRIALQATLAEWGYEVVAIGDGVAAYEALRQEDGPKLALLDWVMPGMEGVRVCRKIRRLQLAEPPYLIVLTAQRGGKENIVTALANGADDYVVKPFDREELKARLQVGARIVGLQRGQTVIFTFARAVEAKSPYTYGHADRVMTYALALANQLDLPPKDQELLRRGAVVHDIGKIAVPDTILNKPGPLTPEEFAVVKQHPAQGAKMVESLGSVRDLIPMIRWHHERMDGRGYPDGLRGEDLAPLVRILAVADVYDALASERPYREALPHDECLQLLRKDAAGGGLDRYLVEAFCRIPPDAMKRGAVRSDSLGDSITASQLAALVTSASGMNLRRPGGRPAAAPPENLPALRGSRPDISVPAYTPEA